MAAENRNKAVSVIRFRLMCIHAINLVPAAGSVLGLRFTAVQPSKGLLIYKRGFRQIFCQKNLLNLSGSSAVFSREIASAISQAADGQRNRRKLELKPPCDQRQLELPEKKFERQPPDSGELAKPLCARTY